MIVDIDGKWAVACKDRGLVIRRVDTRQSGNGQSVEGVHFHTKLRRLAISISVEENFVFTGGHENCLRGGSGSDGDQPGETRHKCGHLGLFSLSSGDGSAGMLSKGFVSRANIVALTFACCSVCAAKRRQNNENIVMGIQKQ